MRTITLLGASLALAMTPAAASLNSAEVTIAINQVEMREPNSPPEAAAVGDVLKGAALLETGKKSRAQLTFNDDSIVRLGANSMFSFNRGTRDLELNQGVILLQVPKAAGGATIKTAAVTAAITGTTIAIEYFPATDNSPGSIKVYVLEGSLRLSLKRGMPGESLLLSAGQMIQMRANGDRLPDPQVFDIERMVGTAGLLARPFPELTSMPIIAESIERQQARKRRGKLVSDDFALHGQIPAAAPFVAQQQNTTLRILSRQNPAARNPQRRTPERRVQQVSRRPVPQPRQAPVVKKPCPCPVPTPPAVTITD